MSKEAATPLSDLSGFLTSRWIGMEKFGEIWTDTQ
jgi:hypothetical protein